VPVGRGASSITTHSAARVGDPNLTTNGETEILAFVQGFLEIPALPDDFSPRPDLIGSE
jgi:hypothetical protein